MNEKWYWLKSNGDVEKITRKKFLRLNQSNIANPCHKLAWKTGDNIQFCQGETGFWIDIKQIKELL